MKRLPATTALLLLATLATTISAATDHYLLSCGATSAVSNAASSYDGRTWFSDSNSNFSSDFSSTAAATSTSSASNVPQIPFSTARVFTTNFTYSFPVSPGPKFVRLFFYLSTYSNYSAADSFLTVTSNSGHLLLRNFSASLSATSPIFKEFYVHVSTSLLQLTFSPTPPSSYAFLNGVEIVSVPETLYVGPTLLNNVAQQGVQFQLTNSTALETAYRLNVGGSEVGSTADAGQMYRRWQSDDQYLTGGFDGSTGVNGDQKSIGYTLATPNYTAPAAVYQSFRYMGQVSNEVKSKVNVTWGFEVDSGFFYLLRLHWCEVTIDINASNYRVFNVYIDHLTAENGADVFQWVGADTAVYRDYVVYVDGRDESGSSRGVLQLAMHPDTDAKSRYEDILLNGLEIFKLSRSNGSLDAPNPTPTPSSNQPPPSQQSPNSPSDTVPAVVGAIAGVVVLALVIFYLLIIRRRKRSKLSSTGPWSSSAAKSYKSGSTTSTAGGSSSLPSDLCRRFSITEIKRATSDFSDSLIIGRGGFGNVYKGTVDIPGSGGPTTVAIKRLNPLSKQGAREFTTEIEMLSKLRHVNLVSLVGFCNDSGEMVLVYEYMPRGTLRDHIFPYALSGPQLPWGRRLEICVGAARGLHYLHAGAGHVMIIHRDVKSTNILLDDKWVAKMSDFGLSKLGPTGTDLSHVSTAVKGSFGYVDPEYYRRQQLTEKSDVYSFGVVLFEVICGRAAVSPGLPKEQVNLAMWGRRNHLIGTLEDIVDPSIKSEMAPECLRKFGEVAESCVRDLGAERPSMADVVWGLEFALQLQKEATANGTGGWPSTPLNVDLGMSTTTTESGSDSYNMMMSKSSGLFSGSSDQGGSTVVFSQILKPEGR